LIFRASFFATLPGVSTILFLKSEKQCFPDGTKKHTASLFTAEVGFSAGKRSLLVRPVLKSDILRGNSLHQSAATYRIIAYQAAYKKA